MAKRWRIPHVRRLDAAGGSVRTFEQIGHTYLPAGPDYDDFPHLLDQEPESSPHYRP
jgi:hypothetical protein